MTKFLLHCKNKLKKIGISPTSEATYPVCDKDGAFSVITEDGVANYVNQPSGDYYYYKVICDCDTGTRSLCNMQF